jgi:hypothetical protein
MNNGTLIVSVAEKTFGIRFGMQSIIGLSAEGAFDEIGDTSDGQRAFMTAAQISKMAWHGYLNWCLVVDQKTEYSREQFFELLDMAYLEDPNLFQSIVTTFSESKILNKKQESEKKRKATMK